MSGIYETPACPYCGAAWTTAMLHELDRHSRGMPCACCVVMPGLELDAAMPTPQRDLCCDSCGKPLYSAPRAAAYTEPLAAATPQYGKPSQS